MKRVLYAAIDLLGGKVVRLRQGERRTAKVYSEDPAGKAKELVAQGARALHVVDLDAAFGERRQTSVLSEIVNDVHAKLNATQVRAVVDVRCVEDVRDVLRRAPNESVCIAGGRHAMGGQQFAEGAILLDTRRFDRVPSGCLSSSR